MSEIRVPEVPADAHPLDVPLHGANPIQAITRFFKNYAKFSGRASRSEYWWVQLVFFVIYIALSAVLFTPPSGGAGSGSGPAVVIVTILLSIVILASIVPNIALSVRRLHDGGFPGLLYLIVLVPSLGSLVLFVLCLLPSKPEGAVYDRYRG